MGFTIINKLCYNVPAVAVIAGSGIRRERDLKSM